MSNATLIVTGAAGLAATIAGGALPLRVRVWGATLLTWGSCAAAMTGAVEVLHHGRTITMRTSQLIPFTGVSLRLTPLGSIFVITTAIVALASTLYWTGYAKHGFSTRTASAAMPLFVTSMLLVPSAASVSTFLILWELMALSSLLLVLTDQARREEARSAAQWYAVMTHLGAAAILLALIVLSSHAGSQNFSAIALHARHLSSGLRASVFLLAVAGFGSKAGMVPFHVWLPKAHAEAPGPASALMSGAMVNLGIYGILLVGDRLLGGGPVWWWLVVMAFGVLSALFGALYAATSTDLKRLLAYSTSDNMGLVLIALGASGLFAASGNHAAATVALVAGLLMMLNHSLFKGTLFLAAGSVQMATGTRNLDRLGGLMRRMPVTGGIFLIGALSVSALPPLNGFVGEWLLFQGLLHGVPTASTAIVIAVLVGVGALALTSGLTVVAFVKATGVGFLGRARSNEAANAHEVPRVMQLGAGLLAMLCVLLGLVPMIVLGALDRAAHSATRTSVSSPVHGWSALHLRGLHGVIAPILLAGGLVLAIALASAWRRSAHRSDSTHAATRSTEPWGSGRQLQTARMQYTATSFAEPVQRVFDDVIRPARDVDVSHATESRYYIERISYYSTSDDLIERKVYRPIIGAAQWWGNRARSLQNGSVHRYLAYGLFALVVILVVIA